MKKLFILLTFVFTLSSFNIFAYWKPLNLSNTIELDYYIDLEKTTKDENSGYVFFTVLIDRKNDIDGVLSFVEQEVADCKKLRTQTIGHTLYAGQMGKGKVIRDLKTPLEESKEYWDYYTPYKSQSISPDAVSSTIIKMVCKKYANS